MTIALFRCSVGGQSAASSPAVFKAKTSRIQTYPGYINAEILQRNLSAEPALLPLIESGRLDSGYQQSIYVTENWLTMTKVNCPGWSHQYIVQSGDSLFQTIVSNHCFKPLFQTARQYRTSIDSH